MVPLGDEAQVEAQFGLSDIVLILAQDRCIVCVERTISSEIILDTPDRTLGDEVQVKAPSIWRLC